jgi:hypothetical protein
MSALSAHLQDAITIVVTSLYAADSQDLVTQQAADILCSDLKRKMTGSAATDTDFRRMTELGATIANQGWHELQDVVPGKIMMPYQRA